MTTRAVLALGLEVLFFTTAFGWRSLLQWPRTGATGFVRPRHDAGLVELAGSVAFAIAVVLLFAAPLAALGGVDSIRAFDSAAVGVAGFAFGVLGIATTIAAHISMGTSWRIGVDPQERTELVTDGVFARVRNPVFSAMILATAGLALLVPNPISVMALVVLVVGVVLQVRWVEEPYLRRLHGRGFDAYVQHTGRFLPRLERRSTR